MEALNKSIPRGEIPSGAKQAAGKGLFSEKLPEKHTAGAKAQHLFCCIYGTTEVVP
jgi:hypothetical protein